MQRSRGHPIVKKLLFPLMAAFAIMANTVTYASEQVLTNSDA
ncbi:DsbC family protein, partial [Salmonella enterica subsp. enterica serovar 8,(20):i:-]|nr:DsbC family protein [Salmonella enterica subsp. enterica serovar 8,(20):i:-]